MNASQTNMLVRRRLLLSLLTAPLAFVCPPWLPFLSVDRAYAQGPTPVEQLALLEAHAGGRLGVAAMNTANQATLLHREGERFPLCSTFKVLLVAAVLQRSMRERALPNQRVHYTADDLLNWAPVTRNQVGQGMSVAELCAATLQYSDNTAANLLMALLGGPSAVTAFARSIGDDVFRLDRWEPELNTAIPGDPRDTTTPWAMAQSLSKLTLGTQDTVLAPPQREQLQRWLLGNTTGAARIRAGVPEDWEVGDKTGSGNYGTTNDVALLRPPAKPPIIVAAYFIQEDQDAPPREDVLAAVGHIVAQAFSL